MKIPPANEPENPIPAQENELLKMKVKDLELTNSEVESKVEKYTPWGPLYYKYKIQGRINLVVKRLKRWEQK